MTDSTDYAGDVPASIKPVPAKPQKLEELDIIKLENLFLKITNLKLQGDKLTTDAQKCQTMIVDHQKQLQNLRDSLSEKYGVDLTRCDIGPDGTIRPKNGA